MVTYIFLHLNPTNVRYWRVYVEEKKIYDYCIAKCFAHGWM